MKIVYRVVHALLAAAVIPVLIFQSFFDLKASPTVLDYGLQLNMSIKRIFDLFLGKDELSDMITKDSLKNITWPAALDPVKGRIISFIVLIAVTVVISLFILVWNCVSGKMKVNIIASAAGLADVIAIMVIFSSIAKEFTSGNINVVSIFTENWLVGFLGNYVSVDSLIIGGFANGILMLFIGMIIWTGVFILTDFGADDNGKAVKKAKKK